MPAVFCDKTTANLDSYSNFLKNFGLFLLLFIFFFFFSPFSTYHCCYVLWHLLYLYTRASITDITLHCIYNLSRTGSLVPLYRNSWWNMCMRYACYDMQSQYGFRSKKPAGQLHFSFDQNKKTPFFWQPYLDGDDEGKTFLSLSVGTKPFEYMGPDDSHHHSLSYHFIKIIK